MARYKPSLENSLDMLKHQYPDIVMRDIQNAKQKYPDLTLNLETYIKDGTLKKMLCLKVTVAVVHRGNTYDIPLCLKLRDSYPYNPPGCFIQCTATTQIFPSRYVDADGKVYLPYFHEWEQPQSDLLGLLQAFTRVFSDQLPVNLHRSQSSSLPGSLTPSPSEEAGSTGAHLPLWDRRHVQGGKLMDTSEYKAVVNQSRIILRDNLRLADVWPHLHQMGVITQNDEDRMRLNATKSESVDRLIAFINTCETWCFHALFRAMAVSNQGHLVSHCGLHPAVYMEDVKQGKKVLHRTPAEGGGSRVLAAVRKQLHHIANTLLEF